MKSVERIDKITEEIWHDMCGEDSSYEIGQETILHRGGNISDNDQGGKENN